jgi:hypothetical protein
MIQGFLTRSLSIALINTLAPELNVKKPSTDAHATCSEKTR